MTEGKRHTSKHLKAAREWLMQAENSFSRDRDVRGELDLFLAQAEMRHAQETNRSRQWRYRYPLLKQGLAFCLAFAVVSAGIGGAYWNLHRQPQIVAPVQTASREIKPVPSLQRLESTSVVQSQKPVAAEPLPAETPGKEAALAGAVERKADKDVVVTPDQMQDLVRTAGKSLRGQ